MKAVVLGGGIAGLSAGCALAAAGVETTIVEAAASPGGLAYGFRDRGYTFDFFSHRLWSRDADILRRVEAWTGAPLQTRRKVSRILLDGRLYNYPIDLRDLLSVRSTGLALRALAGYASARLAGPPGGDDFRTFLRGRYGAPLYDTFFGPYTEKLTGCRASELSIDLALGAVPSPGLLTQLVHRLVGRIDPWDDFHYPPGGFMDLPDGMARAFTVDGGRLLLSHRLQRLRCDGDRVTHVEVESTTGTVALATDLVVSTVPLGALLAGLDPAPGSAVLRAAAALRSRAMVAVYLGIRRPRLSPDHWIYVPDPTVRFNRLSETTNYSERMAPPGRTGLCVEIACDAGDEVWSDAPERQIRRAVDDLVRLGLLRSAAEVEAGWTRRFPAAYPVYRVGFREHLQSIEAALAPIGNLKLAGRQGAFWYASTAEGIRQGLDLVAGAGLALPLAA